MVSNTSNGTQDDIGDAEKTYFTSDVARMLGMATTTIRKYSQSLEDMGYTFLKGKGTGTRQARLYTEKDVTVIRYLKEVREETNITVERATAIVIERFGKGTTQRALSNREPTINELERFKEQYNDQYAELVEILKNQNETIHILNERIEKLENEMQPTNQIEAPKETETVEPYIKKKSLLARIFNK